MDSISQSLAVVIDCETNGRKPLECIELGKIVVTLDRCKELSELLADGDVWDTLRAINTRRYKPNQPSTPDALGAHGIFSYKLKDCLPSSHAKDHLNEILFGIPNIQYVIGHNVDYDLECLGDQPCKRICTLALSRHLWPELESHRLWSMLYALYDESASGPLSSTCESQTATGDVLATMILAGLIAQKSGVRSFADLHALSETARIPTHMPFGKHKGELISTIPSSYKNWLRNQPDVDKYLLIALDSGGLF